MRPPRHRPYFGWPTFALRLVVERLHMWLPWASLMMAMELHYRDAERAGDKVDPLSVRVRLM